MSARKAKIGLGITTYNRPKYFRKTSDAVSHILLPYVDACVVYNDGSDFEYKKHYEQIYRKLPQSIEIIDADFNRGVAHAKNSILRNLLSEDCDLLFILEDDVVPVSKMAIIGYLAAVKMTGVDHLMFAHHGPLNTFAVGKEGPIIFWPNCVGAYTFYTRGIIEQVGFMDENFKNAWEHVEHTWRIMKHHKLPFGYYPDVLSSELWLKEIPGSIEKSSIAGYDTPERLDITIQGLKYWKEKDRDFPAEHILEKLLNVKHSFTHSQ